MLHNIVAFFNPHLYRKFSEDDPDDFPLTATEEMQFISSHTTPEISSALPRGTDSVASECAAFFGLQTTPSRKAETAEPEPEQRTILFEALDDMPDFAAPRPEQIESLKFGDAPPPDFLGSHVCLVDDTAGKTYYIVRAWVSYAAQVWVAPKEVGHVMVPGRHDSLVELLHISCSDWLFHRAFVVNSPVPREIEVEVFVRYEGRPSIVRLHSAYQPTPYDHDPLVEERKAVEAWPPTVPLVLTSVPEPFEWPQVPGHHNTHHNGHQGGHALAA